MNYLEFAVTIAKSEGDKIKNNSFFKKMAFSKENDDIVTNGDLFIHDSIYKSISEQYPNHGFISEERNINKVDSDFIWILDPIDGTKYFYQGVPLYSISLALKYKNELIIGVVYLPEMNQLFSAEKNKGATLNGARITCSSVKSLSDCTIVMEIPNRNAGDSAIVLSIDKMKTLIKTVKRIRIIGVGSIGLVWCAMGGFDYYINYNPSAKIWDLSAGIVILKEAGGQYAEGSFGHLGGSPALFSLMEQLLLST